jgi:DNA helicase II / ATP-dependent DNA helicase PcrA
MLENLEKITAQLNPAQKKAVETLDGPLLILAGAGSGKTRVLTQRTALLIASGKASANEILAVTFTNKAAREMESRIYRSMSEIGVSILDDLWVSTFHSFCTRVLRRHIELLDYKPFFSIYDDGDQLSQIKKVMTSLNISEKTTSAKAFRNRINTAKMLGLSPVDVEKSSKIFLDKNSLEVYRRYEQEMKKANALDFGDLLLKVHELLKMYPVVLEQYQNQFKYVMVDEYQDTNHIQYLMVKMLAQKSRNLCVVGDEDQSIYSWRGADIRNILDFEKDFPEAQIVKLEENYRSTQNIVNAATKVIKNNKERKDKTLFTQNPHGDPLQIREERNEYDEARFVVKTIQQLMTQGEGSFSDYAIFYRTNAQSRVLEEQLRSHSIPYQIVGGVRFYERMEIKDVLGYMKLSVNRSDDMAFKRIINTPARGIGKTTVDRLEELSIERNISLFEMAEKAVEEREFAAGTTSKIRAFLNLMEELFQASRDYNLVDYYQIILDKTEYLQKLKKDENPESDARIDNLEELSNALTQFMKERDKATLQDFLEEMALVSDIDTMDETVKGVTLMTLHVSKGLEFPYVFIVGLEENLFPSGMADDDEASELEEERRLCYVGMTRAREKLFLTYARSRRVWGQEQFNTPSRFLKEVPNELINFTSSFETPRFVAKHMTSSEPPIISAYRPRTKMEDDTQAFPDYEGMGAAAFSKGMKVRHPTFGVGSIFQVEGSGEQERVTVLFSDQTIKKFVTKYARLERV